jgi:hypothetical protein
MRRENFATRCPARTCSSPQIRRPGPRPRNSSAPVGLEPAYLGDASATATVDALLPLWFALVKQNGGDRRVALRGVTDR